MSVAEFSNLKQNWELAINRGNSLCQKNNHSAAERHYEKALFYSEIMIRSYEHAQQYNFKIASPFFVACVNLANNLWAMKDLKKAGDYFFYGVWGLKMLSRTEGISEVLRLEATKNWEKSVLALVDFYHRTNQKPAFDFWNEDVYDKIADAKKGLDETRFIGLN